MRRPARLLINKAGKAMRTGYGQHGILSLSRHPQPDPTTLANNHVMAAVGRDRSVERLPEIMRRPDIITRGLPGKGEHMAALVTSHRHVVIASQAVRHREGVLAMRTFQLHL